MPLEFKDRVLDVSTTTGTGTLTLTGTPPIGYRSFASAHTNRVTVRYVAYSADNSQWEVGEGVYNAGTLTRVTVFASSNSGNLVNFTVPLSVTSTVTAADAGSVTGILDKVMVSKTNAQSSTNAVTTLVNFNNVVYDTNGLFDSASGGIKPKRAGYYQVNLRYRQNTTSFQAAHVNVGANYYAVGADTNAVPGCGGSIIVYCNGSSDIIKGGAYVNSGGAITTTGETYMQVFGPL